MSKFALLLIFLLSSVLPVFAQNKADIDKSRAMIRQFEQQRYSQQSQWLGKTPTPNQREYDVTSYSLSLSLFPDTQQLDGTVTMTASSLTEGLNHVEIDLLDNMSVSAVFSGTTPLSFTHQNDILDVSMAGVQNTGDTFSIEVHYSGNPQSGGLGTWGWNTHSGTPIIWTLSEPFGAPAWWPCKDDPMDKADSVFLSIEVPNDLVVASNGLFLGIINESPVRDRYLWETHYPISTYLVSLAISNYESFSNTYVSAAGDTMPVDYYVYPEQLADAQEDFSVTPAMIGFFSSVFGEYPFINEKYGMAVFPWGGAMEHQTMTSYGANLITGSHTYDYINAHELAHQWFGDCITMGRWSHIWMNEGFASYAEALWAENLGGIAAYHDYINSQERSFFQGSLFITDSTNANTLFNNTVYDKGSWTLHMLRGVLGDSVFFDALRSYATSPEFYFGNAVTEDFQRVCETVSGRDLEWFFSQWVYRPGRPNYVYEWTSASAPSGFNTILTLSQTTSVYKMPLQVKLSTALYDTTFTVWDSLDTQYFVFNTSDSVQSLVIDPDNWVLKNINEGSLHAVSGTVRNLADNSPIPFAQVYWQGPYDPATGAPLNGGVDTTDAAGQFSFAKATGDYAIGALADSFNVSQTTFITLNEDIANLDIYLAQPKGQPDIDSLSYQMSDGETRDTTLTVANSGSGDMYVQLVEGNFISTPPPPVQNAFRASQVPIREMMRSRSVAEQAIPLKNAPAKLVYSDGQEFTDNPYDLKDVMLQSTLFRASVTLTTYGPVNSFDNLRVNLFLDVDNNFLTGLPLSGMGADYLIAIGNFGGGFTSYKLEWNELAGDFLFLGPTIGFSADASTASITVQLQNTSIGNPDLLKMFITSFDVTNLIHTIDYAPQENLGYLTASLSDPSVLSEDKLFATASASQPGVFQLTIDPAGLSNGFHSTGFTVYSTGILGMSQSFIPVDIDYATALDDDRPTIPKEFTVQQNYPNPFNPTTRIRFGLPDQSEVRVDIFNLLGQNVYSQQQTLNAGYHLFSWNGTNNHGTVLPSGVYFYRVSDGNQTITRKMVLMR